MRARHVLVPRGAGEPVAVLRRGQLVRRHAVEHAAAVVIGVGEAEPVRQRHVAGQQRVGDLDRGFDAWPAWS